MRHHRTDEYGQPTDQSLLCGGYEVPQKPNVVAVALVLTAACLPLDCYLIPALCRGVVRLAHLLF